MIRALIILYGVFVALWFTAFLLVPDQWWPLVLLNKLALYFLVPAIPVFIVALITWRFRTVVFALAPVVVFGYFYAPFFIPKTLSNNASPKFRVMTFNIWNQNKQVDLLLTVVNVAKPDVVAVQELMDDIQPEFVAKMAIEYPYYHISPMVYGGATALFSKYALTNVHEIDFGIDRPAIVADVNIERKVVRVIGAHLYPSYYSYHDRPVAQMPKAIKQYITDQQVQIKMLKEIIESSGDMSVILACDCNVQRTSSSRVLLEEALTDSAVALGWQRGNPPANAQFETDIGHIDYLWYGGDIQPVGLYRSKQAGGSDHAPVYADFIM